MYKKTNAEIPLFATENEFHTLLAIHNEIKKAVYKMFPYIKEQIIETLFSILSSHALLYDQIIRKAVLLQGSITKQTQITKLVQVNKVQLEKKVHEHLNSFNTNYEYPSDTKNGVFTSTTSQGKLTNLSKEDSILLDQETIFSKMKKKISPAKPHHIRTNSAGSTFNQFATDEIKKKPNLRYPPQTEKKPAKILKGKKIGNKKRIISKEKPIVKFDDNYELHFENDNTQVQDISPCPKRSNRQRCLTERKISDDFSQDIKLHPLLSYQSFPSTNNPKIKRMGSKPTNYTKYLLKKYHDVVDSYEKFETEEDDLLKLNPYHSQIFYKTDFIKKTNELQNSTQSFIITDYKQSKNKPKPKPKNRNTSCRVKPQIKTNYNFYYNAWK